MSVFPTPDPELIALYGEAVVHTPEGGDPTEVRCIRTDLDTLMDNPNGALLAFFGTMVNSGFAQRPAKNDTFTVGSSSYRVFDVKSDWAGGDEESAGIFIYLTK